MVFLLVFINESAKLVSTILIGVCILFMLKNIIQNFYFALIKYKKNIGCVLIEMISDTVRIIYYYKLIYHFASGVERETGLGWFGWILGYIVAGFVGSFIYLGGEAQAMTFGMDNTGSVPVLKSIFFTACLVAFYYILV